MVSLIFVHSFLSLQNSASCSLSSIDIPLNPSIELWCSKCHNPSGWVQMPQILGQGSETVWSQFGYGGWDQDLLLLIIILWSILRETLSKGVRFLNGKFGLSLPDIVLNVVISDMLHKTLS